MLQGEGELPGLLWGLLQFCRKRLAAEGNFCTVLLGKGAGGWVLGFFTARSGTPVTLAEAPTEPLQSLGGAWGGGRNGLDRTQLFWIWPLLPWTRSREEVAQVSHRL